MSRDWALEVEVQQRVTFEVHRGLILGVELRLGVIFDVQQRVILGAEVQLGVIVAGAARRGRVFLLRYILQHF